MKVLLTWGMVMDLEPSEIPEVAARLDQTALDGVYTALDQAERPLTEEEAEEFKELFQWYGVSYSVQREVEPPVA
jgi:hypothetical protein